MSTRDERWRLVLGKPADRALGTPLDADQQKMDEALNRLYGGDSNERGADLSLSSPRVARWLGDIRSYFPAAAVRIMQKDAVERLGLTRLLLEPELLDEVEPDVHLAATLISMAKVIPDKAKDSARRVVRRVVDEVEKRLRSKMLDAVRGALHKASRTRRPKGDLDFDRTIRKNLHNYLPDRKRIIAEQLIGYGRRQSSLVDVVLCVDQSGSMATSVVYAGIFGAVIASLRAVRTHMVVFDTAVVDLTAELDDPVDLLFGTQLGGGTDINQALAYCQSIVTRPEKTVMVLITDLYEGGDRLQMLARARSLVDSGVNLVCLLALSDAGAPMYDSRNAGQFAALGIPTFAATPDQFPDLIATAIRGGDIAAWAAREGIVTARAE